MDKQKALQNLIDLKSIFDKAGITFWLEAGTCLGAIREKDFIGHDQDIDIGIYAEQVDNTNSLCNLFFTLIINGFNIYHTFGTIDNGFEMALWRNEIKIDVFWFYPNMDEKTRFHSAWLNGGRNGSSDQLFYDYPAEIINNLRTINFLGEWFNVPAETEKYLEIKYGPDWRTPVVRWDWARSPFNLRK